MYFCSVNQTFYFFNCEDGIWVRLGSFFGTIEQFREHVKENKTGIIKKEYLMISDLVENEMEIDINKKIPKLYIVQDLIWNHNSGKEERM